MTERQALETLIQACDWLSLKEQRQLIEILDTITPEEQRSMGKFLATTLKTEAHDLEQQQAVIGKFLNTQT